MNVIKRDGSVVDFDIEKIKKAISLAMDAAEEQLLNGTASSQVITHFLKLATAKEELERKRLEADIALANAKKKMMNLFGDDDEDNEDEMDIKKRTETVTLKMSKITNELPKDNKLVSKPVEPKPEGKAPVKKEEEKPTQEIEQKEETPA